MSVEIILKLVIGAREDKEAGAWVGYCPALGIYSQGESADEALTAIQSASLLYVEHCYRRKLLDDVLNRQGFSPGSSAEGAASASDQMILIRNSYQHTSSIDVPLHLIKNAAAEPPLCA